MNDVKFISTTEEKQWEQLAVNKSPAGELLEITDKKHQEVDGFGGCFNELGWLALNKLPKEERDIIINELFDAGNGCNFNFCRLPIGASDYAAEWYSLNETDGDYEMKNFSIERDRSYLIPYIRIVK